MAGTRHKLKASFYEEAVPGTSTAWPTSGNLIHLAGYPDLSSVAQTIVPDESTTARVSERRGVGVKGLRNCTANAAVYLTGKGEVTSDTAQVAETALMMLLEHCFGGMARSYATTCKTAGTHTTTQVELTSATGYAAGQLIGVVDADDAAGLVRWNRIEDLTGDIATLAQAYDFTPADGDKVVGTATAFVDPDVLEDSNAAGRQLSWIFDVLDAVGITELIGTKAQPGFDGLEPNGLVRLTLAINAPMFNKINDAALSDPTWSGTTSGGSPLAWGPYTKFWFQDYGTTTATRAIHPSGLSIDPGVAVTSIPSGGSQTDNMQGIAGWSSGPANAKVGFTVTPHATDYDVDLQAGTFKALGIERRGAEGGSICFWFPRMEIEATPVLGTNGEVLAHQVQLVGHEDLDAIGTTDIIKSTILIGLG